MPNFDIRLHFGLPKFFTNEETQQQGQILYIILLLLLSMSVLGFVVFMLITPVFTLSMAVTCLVIAIFGGLIFSLRRGHVRFVSVVLCITLLLSVTVVLFSYYGLGSMDAATYLLIIFVASQVGQQRLVIFCGATSLLCCLLIFFVSTSGHAPFPVDNPTKVFGDTFILSILIIITTFAAAYANQVLHASHSRLQAQNTLLAAQIEQRRQAEAALRQSEANYRQLVEMLPDGVAVANQAYQLLYANPAALRIYGVPDFQHLAQASIKDLVLPEEHAKLETHMADLRQGTPDLPPVEYVIDTADGRKVELEVRTCPIQYLNEPAYLALTRDITERKQAVQALRAKEAAEAANKAKSLFLASMSHELRTPLTAIIGYGELLQEAALEQTVKDKLVRSRTEKILNSAHHLLLLISDILDFSKIEAGKLDLNWETFSLAGLVDEVITTVQPLVAKNNNQLQVAFNTTHTSLTADPTRIKQILFNLLSNAAKFTENGKIHFTITAPPAENPKVCFTVTDTGIGIAPDQVGQLFQAFQQVKTNASYKYGGTGLGLAISRQLCRMHGGDITLHSRLGQGSTFTVCLPLTPQDPNANDSLPNDLKNTF